MGGWLQLKEDDGGHDEDDVAGEFLEERFKVELWERVRAHSFKFNFSIKQIGKLLRTQRSISIYLSIGRLTVLCQQSTVCVYVCVSSCFRTFTFTQNMRGRK